MSKRIVFIKDNQLVTNSLVLAEQFGREHRNVLASLRSLEKSGHLNALDFKPVKYTDPKGEERPMIELSERGFLIAMPFIGGNKSRDGQVLLVDAFLEMKRQLNNASSIMQRELHSFSVQCRLSEQRATIAAKALNERKKEILSLDRQKVELEAKYQHQLRLVN